jgi:2-polyprenyl-3-methyl-5-hydroxy-6-metoxy-1,4-benzoquinol methylase
MSGDATAADIAAGVRAYYGETLSSSADLKTGACCSPDAMPAHVRALLPKLHAEVKDRFYGCGSPIPPALDGAAVLDLGCGAGRDVYLLSGLVGAQGRVVGVDMTAAQLAVARRHQAHHAAAFGHPASNVEFLEGDLTDLSALGVAPGSMDVIVSNCVLNLVADKARAFASALHALKPGGELYFADVFCDRRLPPALLADPVLVGECLAGALYTEDFRRLMQNLGVADCRVVARSPVPLLDAQIEARIGFAHFESITWRVFKLDLEDRCEDYGQIATYRGTLPEAPHAFLLDDHHLFESGRPLRVCGNTFDMLAASRYARHFDLVGDRSRHFGLFDCGPAAPAGGGDCASGVCC